jgi:toxin YoeB
MTKRSTVIAPAFLDDLQYFVANDPKTSLRALELMRAILRDPFVGIGKPEPLKSMGPNIWSRRLTREHRIVYRVFDDRVEFLQARYHYSA